MRETVGGAGDRPDRLDRAALQQAVLQQTVLDQPVSGQTVPDAAVLNATAFDQIVLRGVRAQGRHGVYAHERSEGQAFTVDATLYLDTRIAARDDDLTATADYGAVAEKIVALIEGEPVNLIETLAARIADACLADPAVQAAEVTVHKPQAPITVPFQDVAVTIRREAHR
jgi:dihydroneopterin aldolase